MFDTIKAIMVEALNLDETQVVSTASLKDDLAIDSLDAAELLMELEDQFGVRIDEKHASTFVTVGDIVAFIEANQTAH